MSAASFTPKGPYSLASSIRFLECFTPASCSHATDGVLRLAFPADDGRGVIGCTVSQKEAADSSPATTARPSTSPDSNCTSSPPRKRCAASTTSTA
ncbi:hypothetical protein [Microtetraspora fusca]|uniref:hypothetical protein n=1 Tax=Microtetraspora fusca TaxID=1997 RepID=UPI001C3F3A06|nr:hypothetical protein [Microtetraspora fusca]